MDRALLVFAALAACACSPVKELAILIEAAPQDLVTLDEPVATNIAVARLGQEVDAQRGERTALDQETGPNAPFRVAIVIAQAGQYAVHIDVLRADQVWSATRCLTVTGVERLSLELVRGGPPDDADGDGWTSMGPEGCGGYAGGLADCDDDEPLAHPFAFDACGSGIDEDCAGGDRQCSDLDGDGVGDERDCDDSDPAVHPGAVEDCDPERDLDCDGEPRCDEDGDHFLAGDDCDDADAAVNPAAPELCDDAIDSDCSGDPSNGCVDDDQDGDGVVAVQAGGQDCSDCDPSIHPGAIEVCGDGVDQDCAGGDEACRADDADHDGVVDEAAGGTDCDDADASVYPGAPEACGSADDKDCDGRAGACDGPDTDGDGWEDDDDCSDGDPAVSPGAAEVCNDVDDDCDGVVDEPANCVSLTGSMQNCGGCWIQCIGRCDVDECKCGDGPDCQVGEACCNGRCADLVTDEASCGGCGLTCGNGEDCVQGVCQCGAGPACTGGDTCCDGACVDLDADPDHCLHCGVECGSDVPCNDGCVCPGEHHGVDLFTDDHHCGRCETHCDTKCDGNHRCEECREGSCQSKR